MIGYQGGFEIEISIWVELLKDVGGLYDLEVLIGHKLSLSAPSLLQRKAKIPPQRISKTITHYFTHYEVSK